MEAKDTVMRDLELWERFGVSKLGIGDWLRETLKAQAEISFKAGYKQSREEMDIQLTSLADLCLEHRKEGMKEVVGFARDYVENKGNIMDKYTDLHGIAGQWQPFVEIFDRIRRKEWGI